jgi:hypothetical protein
MVLIAHFCGGKEKDWEKVSRILFPIDKLEY